MRLKLLKEGAWEISEMQEIEFFLLKQIAKAADPAESEGARARLFPEVAAENAKPGDGAGSTESWRELVVPELKELFQSAVDRVTEDLERAELVTGDDGDRNYRARVPAGHADQWYSAMNQARIVLAEKFDLPMNELEFVEEEADVDGRWLANVQSNLYAFVQTFLLETVMKIPGE